MVPVVPVFLRTLLIALEPSLMFISEARAIYFIAIINPLYMASLRKERCFQSTSKGALTAHVEWVPGVATEALQYHLHSIRERGGYHSGVMVSTLAWEVRGLWFNSQLWQFFPALPLPAA